MKKLLFTLLGVALAAGLHAQTMDGIGITVEKVDADKLKSAITKSDAEIADAKKALKAATWIKRGAAFFDADAKPVNGIYSTMPEAMLVATFGEDVTPQQETVGGDPYSVYNYEHFKAYVADGEVRFFTPNTVIDPRALDKSMEAYEKAYEIDSRSANSKKVADALELIRSKSIENGGVFYTMEDFKAAGESFRRAYRASAHPSIGRADTTSLYFAGMSSVYGQDYPAALADLDKVLAMGHEDNGEVYRLKFLAMYNMGDREPSLEVLKQGLERYPNNEDLIDMMMKYYADNDGDASSMIPMVEAAIAKNPSNPSLYQGLARVYDKLGQSDDAIASIKRAVAITPDDFYSNYLEGLFVVKKADAMDKELSNMTITSRTQYQEALKGVNDVYIQAVEPLERAYALDPSEISTVELLKNLTFRLRENADMNAKYEKYTALLETMEAAN